MPSFGDTALIALIALLLFGPKKLPELARQLGKLMGEFRRASNEFRWQMEEELRASEQKDRESKIAAMPPAAEIAASSQEPDANNVEQFATDDLAEEEHDTSAVAEEAEESSPIAVSGDLSMKPPSTGLPTSRDTLSPLLESIPHADAAQESVEAELSAEQNSCEAPSHG